MKTMGSRPSIAGSCRAQKSSLVPHKAYLCRVRKVIAIFFLAVVLLAQSPLQQLLRLPVLLEHFREHQAIGGGISFLDFIQLHYLSGNPKDDDYDRDNQLPFRADDVVLMGSMVDVPDNFEMDLLPAEYKEVSYPLIDCTQLSPSFASGIWQPPRVG